MPPLVYYLLGVLEWLCRKFSCEAIWGMLSPGDAE
jgi:hypothetical protein